MRSGTSESGSFVRGVPHGVGRAIRSRAAILIALSVLVAASGVAATPTAEIRFHEGSTLTEALLELQKRGVPLVFSSQVVRPEMKVRGETRSRDPRALLEEILAPHSLEAKEEGGLFVIVPGKARVEPKTSPAPARPVWSEEIVVQPSRVSLLAEQPAAPVSLSRDELQALPHLGDDVFRALRLLPGIASSDLSAELNLRGGRRDELLIRLDGQELYDAFHLKEYDNALSIVAASTLASADLTTGALASSYGDRMGGVLDMTTIEARPRHFRIEATIVGLQVEAGHSFRDDRAKWFLALRRGNTDLLGRAFHLEGPGFWDGFGKVESDLTARQSIGLRVLAAADRLSFTIPEQKELRTGYTSSYVWLTHRVSNGSTLFVDTIASAAKVERDRRGFETDEERTFVVRDERRLSVNSLVQSWNVQAAERHFVSAGFEARRFDARYDYFSDREFVTPLVAIRAEPRQGVFAADLHVMNDQTSIYASDRMRLAGSLTIDAGARLDRHTSTGETILSPRFNAAWAIAPSTVVRLGWGRFLQSQRAHELRIEDGETRLDPAERSSQFVAGFEHRFDPASSLPLASVRVEVYRRYIGNPRPRYENLLGPYDPFPEGEVDRVRIDPESATARGLELVVQGRPSAQAGWFFNYTLASTKDRIDGAEIPRSIDQRHAFNFDLRRRIGRHWDANLAWVYRTGYPTTDISAARQLDAEGEPVLVPRLGPINGRRLPSYHRLDLRLSREWRRRRGTMTIFADIHNVYNRGNVSGVDVKLDEEAGTLAAERELWPRFFASVGVTWELGRR